MYPLLLILLLPIVLVWTVLRRPRLPLPPGPRPDWLCRTYLPKVTPWITYADWSRKYGNFFYIRVRFGSPVLVINSLKVADDLLEKKGSIYSSRPVRPMVNELMGWDWLFSSMPYTPWWRRHRSLFHQYFQPSVLSSYDALQSQEVSTMLRNLLRTPDKFEYHIRRTQAAVVLNIVYGHRVKEEGDDYIPLADAALISLGEAGVFGAYLVDYIPLLKHLPLWCPGAGFKRKAAKWRKLSLAMVNVPFSAVQSGLAEGTAIPCFVSKELEKMASPTSEEDVQLIKNVAAIAYAAGTDTTSVTLTSFVLAILFHPDAMKKAQMELDRVVGTDRLPCVEDRKDLPYVDCIVQESLRWNPVTPLSLPHFAIKDDEYEGYRIPKGTTVLPNVWAMLHDSALYPDPMTFMPERFADPEANLGKGINPNPEAIFGFGRRTCPGRWLARNSLFMTIASILAVYDILPALDDECKPILPQVEYTTSILSRPKPYQCRFVPRSEAAIALINQTTAPVL